MKPRERHRPLALIAAASIAWIAPAPARAADCPTASFDQVLLLGSCTIAGALFDFTHPQLASHPVWFNGPFAGNTGLGPGAAALAFIPDASAAHPGFTLSGDFRATGAASRFNAFSGSIKTGNYFDEVLGYILVTPAGGMGLTGYSIALGDAAVTQGAADGLALANLNGATAALNNDGFSQLTETVSFGELVVGAQFFISNLKTYAYSADPSAVARFGSVSYAFLQAADTPPVTAVPEPESFALILAGLAAIAGVVRRRSRRS